MESKKRLMGFCEIIKEQECLGGGGRHLARQCKARDTQAADEQAHLLNPPAFKNLNNNERIP